jgi:hypothetical protein
MEKPTKTEQVIKFIVVNFFKRRFFILLLGIAGIALIAIKVYRNPTSSTKDIVEVVTGGVICLTLFYHMINYENDQMKFKHDVKIFREKLSFNIATEWHKIPMVDYMQTLKKFLKKCEPLLKENDAKMFHETIENEENEDQKKALIAVFNYFESISLGVKQDIMDEEFIRGFFGSIFAQYFQEYAFYIDYRRRIKKNANLWINFTNLASRWVRI